MASSNWMIFEPPGGAQRTLDGAAGFVTVRDGFSRIAFLVPLLWLPFRRAWFGLVVYVVAQVAIALVVAGLKLSPGVALLLSALVNLAVGLEASWLRGRSLERRGYRLVAGLQSRSREEAEAIFFEDWLAHTPQERSTPDASNPNAPYRPASAGVLGLFPQPGAAR